MSTNILTTFGKYPLAKIC